MNLINFLKTYSKISNKFIDDFFGLYNYETEKDDYVIDLEIVVKWLKARKDSIKRTLLDSYTKNIDYKIGKFSMMANSRARSTFDEQGFVKILSCTKTDKILGAHIIAREAGNTIHEIVVAMEFGGSAEDIARTCHAHPTYNEAVKEACLAVDKRQIHS